MTRGYYFVCFQILLIFWGLQLIRILKKQQRNSIKKQQEQKKTKKKALEAENESLIRSRKKEEEIVGVIRVANENHLLQSQPQRTFQTTMGGHQ